MDTKTQLTSNPRSLMAAAPELLMACRFILKHDISKIGSVGEGVLRSAIAKAEGAPSHPKETKSSGATSVSSEKICPEDWSVLDHFTSPSTPVTGIEVEKWSCEENGDATWNIKTGKCVLQMVTDDYQMACDLVDEHNASLERILGRTGIAI